MRTFPCVDRAQRVPSEARECVAPSRIPGEKSPFLQHSQCFVGRLPNLPADSPLQLADVHVAAESVDSLKKNDLGFREERSHRECTSLV